MPPSDGPSLGGPSPATSANNFTKPSFNIYGTAGGTAAGSAAATSDPYTYGAATVNLSGKIGVPPVDPNNGPSSTSAAGGPSAQSLMNTVASVVESGYQSARQVVFGDQVAATSQAGGGPSSSTSFSLFSLSYQQIVQFAIAMFTGALFMFLAFLFLPMIVIAPQKFTLLFSLGCLCWIAGLARLQGVGTLVAAMVQKERLPISLSYAGSLVGTLYATVVAHSYLLTILFAAIQIVALAAFMVSYFPGGIRMLSMVKDMVMDRAKSFVGIGGGSTVLPL